jgi:hypothetical protein
MVLQACTETVNKVILEEQRLVKKSLNPGGDRELVMLMRAMFAEVKRIKKQVLKGEDITVLLAHEKILSTHATEPKKTGSVEYKT